MDRIARTRRQERRWPLARTNLSALAESLRRIARGTQIVVSSTMVDGTYVPRPCFINARTEPADVVGFVDTVVRMGDELATAGWARS